MNELIIYIIILGGVTLKKVLITSSSCILLIAILSACEPSEKNTESTVSVTPVASLSPSSTLIPIVVSTITPITSVMPSEKPSPNTQQTATSKVKNIYYNKKYNFNLTLPDNWLGKYEVLEAVDENNIGSVNFISTKNKSSGGSVFAIGIWTKAMWDSQGVDIIRNTHTTKIGEKDESVFTISTPTDVEYDLTNQNAKSEYFSMHDDVKSIESSFILN
jgi:hypothetical protein